MKRGVNSCYKLVWLQYILQNCDPIVKLVVFTETEVGRDKGEFVKTLGLFTGNRETI